VGTSNEDTRTKKDDVTIARTVPEAIQGFKDHLKTCVPERLQRCETEEQRTAEMKQDELEARLADLIEDFYASGQRLSAALLTHTLSMLHNREEIKIKSLCVSLELMNLGLMEMLMRPDSEHMH
jgi:hypothetical protein